jgi:hypothetical protein
MCVERKVWFRVQGSGYKILDTGYWMLDTGFREIIIHDE